MAELFEFSTEGAEAEVLIAVREPGEAVVAVGIGDWVRKKAGASLESVFSMVGAVARAFERGLDGAPVERAELELGLDFTGGEGTHGGRGRTRARVRPERA